LVLKEIGVTKDQIILDFGCHSGTYTIPAARIVGNKGLVYALDKDPVFLDNLRKKVKEEQLENVKSINNLEGVKEDDEFFHYSPIIIPLKDSLVDVVLLYDVIHLMGYKDNGKTVCRSKRRDREKLYSEVCRVAKPNALISVYAPHLRTHTDIESEEDIKKELEDYGFRFKKEIYLRLIHDGNFVEGMILNFRKT